MRGAYLRSMADRYAYRGAEVNRFYVVALVVIVVVLFVVGVLASVPGMEFLP